MRFGRVVKLLALLTLASPVMADTTGSGAGHPGTIAALYLGGLLFLLFEIFLVPGFGLPGTLGLGLLAANGYLVFQSYGGSAAWGVISIQVVLGMVAAVVAMKVLPHTALGKMMTHSTTLKTKAPAAPDLDPDLFVGRQGKTQGSLSPQGTVVLDGQEFEAKVKSGLIQSGQEVKVIGVDRQTLVVELVQAEGNR